jgi:hypothetical protein
MTKDKPKLKKLTCWFKTREEGSEVRHKTERHRDGTYTCFCPGDVYGVQKGIRCWHVKRLQEVAVKVDSSGKYELPELDPEDYKEE